MRIKLSINSPLPNYNCWFSLTEKYEERTIHHLRKKIVKDLELNSEPCLLQLSMDGFHLLPQSNIQGLLRDGDLINVEKVNSSKTITKKRKISSIEEKKDTLQPITKKSKKELKQKKIEKKNKGKSDTPSEKKKEKFDKSAEKKTRKSVETLQKTLSTTNEQSKPVPFEGKLSTKKRNMRRRALKRRLRTVVADSNLSEAPIETNVINEQELQIQNLNISNAEPLQLLKKNKNKKKNHMKQMEQRSHVIYPEEEEKKENEEEKEEEENNHVEKTNKNKFGRAFVTFVECEKKYTERPNSKFVPHEYPIHRVPTLFYANKGITENDLLTQQETEVTVTDQQDSMDKCINQEEPKQVETIHKKPLNYDEFPDANFTDNVPSIGTKLAIKTLELTSTYTPEISDWKQVILKQIDPSNNQVTFEFLPGFGKASTKGGKFDNKKNRKRNDDWFEQQHDDEEGEEEEEETEATFEITDIFAMKTMS